jgi:putative tricarboxylic transport membrane protein
MLEGLTGVVENLGNLFTFYNFMLLVLGVCGGIILGALPGVSPTLSVALLVPLTFYMEPSSGLILLGAVYTASVAGGAISAILINVPGAPANIATLIDGYPMAKAGKAETALYTCFISSFIGGVFGMFVMILLTVPLAEVALKFKSTEIFWVAVLGLTVVAGLGKPGTMIKSLMAGAFGVWLSTIGPNPVTGEFRFIFHDILTGGVHIIPVLIGLFAVPQILTLVESYGKERTVFQLKREKGILKKTFLGTLRMTRVLSIGSVIGSVIGLIPGVGGQVAGIVSYDQVRKFSKNPSRFGTGIPDGIAAAESANNAMVGPSLVPLLTLSIPGSPTAAVLLGGLLIHGIFPGPDLFRLYPDVVHTFIGSLLLAQFLMLVFGILLSRYSNWVMRVPDLYMAASIVVLATFGTYCVNNNFNDVIVMFVIGTTMYLGSKAGFSALPVVMGYILGGIAENNFLKGMLLASAGKNMFSYFFTGWINVTVILLCIASLVYGIYSSRKGKEDKKGVEGRDLIVAPLVFFLSLWIYKTLDVSDPMSAIFPTAMLVILGGLALLIFILTVIGLRTEGMGKRMGVVKFPFSRISVSALLTIAYLYFLNIIGFYATSFVFHIVFSNLSGADLRNGKSRVFVKVLISAVFVGVLYVLFKVILKVQAPTGLVL